jgi:hypothetical protein
MIEVASTELDTATLDAIVGGAARPVAWANDDESPKEEVTFEYGVLAI